MRLGRRIAWLVLERLGLDKAGAKGRRRISIFGPASGGERPGDRRASIFRAGRAEFRGRPAVEVIPASPGEKASRSGDTGASTGGKSGVAAQDRVTPGAGSAEGVLMGEVVLRARNKGHLPGQTVRASGIELYLNPDARNKAKSELV